MRQLNKIEQAYSDMAVAKKEINWNGHSLREDSGHCLSGFTSTSGKKKYYQYPCHNYIRTYLNADALWSAFGTRCSEEITKLYFNWLCFDSPWSKTGIIPKLDPERMYAEGFVWDNLDKVPANLLHNFLIATRVPSEHRTLAENWYFLVTEVGLDPSFAFVMLVVYVEHSGKSFLKTAKDNRCYKITYNYNDWALDISTATEKYINNFLSGQTPGLSKAMFFPFAETRPINCLWGPPGRSNPYSIKLDKLYKAKYSITTKEKTFSDYNDSVYYPFGNVLEILKQEEARFILRLKKEAA